MGIFKLFRSLTPHQLDQLGQELAVTVHARLRDAMAPEELAAMTRAEARGYLAAAARPLLRLHAPHVFAMVEIPPRAAERVVAIARAEAVRLTINDAIARAQPAPLRRAA